MGFAINILKICLILTLLRTTKATPFLGNVYKLRSIDFDSDKEIPVSEDIAKLNWNEFRDRICQEAKNIIMLKSFGCIEDSNEEFSKFVLDILRLVRMV